MATEQNNIVRLKPRPSIANPADVGRQGDPQAEAICNRIEALVDELHVLFARLQTGRMRVTISPDGQVFLTHRTQH